MKEVVIIQISDREGFQSLVEKLRAKDLKFTVEPVPEECFSYAQGITCRKLSSVKGRGAIKEGEHESWFEYHFPHPSQSYCHSSNGSLLKTSSESFSLLRIFAK